jgi:uncharacterized protein YbbK (DUF523 family)
MRTPDPITKPRVGISRCLLGDAVRYDGGHKRHPTLVRVLGPHVDWVRVCPEVEMGMGTPREPVELLSRDSEVRMIGVTSRRDWTDAMRAFAAPCVATLQALGLDGYIFKSRSPSCNVHGRRGLFADAVVTAMPDLPVADETELADADACERFLERVRARRSAGG